MLSLLVPACSYLPEMPTLSTFKPYRIDIQQGNFLSPEMTAQLRKGMTREQVRFVLGTPLVTDIFHADRWDYVFYRELGNGTKEQKRLSVFFEDNKLARANGDNLPVNLEPLGAEEPKADAGRASSEPQKAKD
jgi:outer membrane protein assembly factor BamE (lipoprotein component of BamABCDE complex)